MQNFDPTISFHIETLSTFDWYVDVELFYRPSKMRKWGRNLCTHILNAKGVWLQIGPHNEELGSGEEGKYLTMETSIGRVVVYLNVDFTKTEVAL